MSLVERSGRLEIFPRRIRQMRQQYHDSRVPTRPNPTHIRSPQTGAKPTQPNPDGNRCHLSSLHHRTVRARLAGRPTHAPSTTPSPPWPSSRAPESQDPAPSVGTTRPGMGRRGEPYYVEAAPPVDVNKNTEWFMYPGVWTTYILLLFFAWLLVLSVSGCSPGAAWTVVNLAHFAVSPHSLSRLSPFLLGFTYQRLLARSSYDFAHVSSLPFSN